MPFTPKPWEDEPSEDTPLDAEGLIDMETRLSGYTDTVAGALDTRVDALEALPAIVVAEDEPDAPAIWFEVDGSGALVAIWTVS